MKKILFTFSMILMLGLCSCGKESQSKDIPFTSEITYSNLADENSRQTITEVFNHAGISDTRQAVFFDHVNQINAVVGEEYLTNSFTTAPLMNFSTYDPYTLQDLWTEKYPDFMGYNCRITAFGLYEEFLRIDESANKRDLFLTFDIDSLENDGSALMSDTSLDAFRVLYSTIPAKDTTDVPVHVQTIQDDWKLRGIEFLPSKNASFITVFFHDKLSDSEYELYIGHVGVLFTAEDALYFVEKVSFQEPYQVLKLNNRTELNDYLMSKYDFGENQTARPFIMENDQLLSEYRLFENGS